MRRIYLSLAAVWALIIVGCLGVRIASDSAVRTVDSRPSPVPGTRVPAPTAIPTFLPVLTATPVPPTPTPAEEPTPTPPEA